MTLFVGIMMPIAFIILSYFSKEDSIKIVNITNENLKLYKSNIFKSDTNLIEIKPNETVCIGNWEGFLGQIIIENRGLSIIKEKYDFLKVVKPKNVEIDLLSIVPKYANVGHENHYFYFIN